MTEIDWPKWRDVYFYRLGKAIREGDWSAVAFWSKKVRLCMEMIRRAEKTVT